MDLEDCKKIEALANAMNKIGPTFLGNRIKSQIDEILTAAENAQENENLKDAYEADSADEALIE